MAFMVCVLYVSEVHVYVCFPHELGRDEMSAAIQAHAPESDPPAHMIYRAILAS
jgi:hypothetical protein